MGLLSGISAISYQLGSGHEIGFFQKLKGIIGG